MIELTSFSKTEEEKFIMNNNINSHFTVVLYEFEVITNTSWTTILFAV